NADQQQSPRIVHRFAGFPFVERLRCYVSTKQRGNGVGLDELTRLVQMIVNDGLRINADRMVNGGQQLGWMNGILNRSRGRRVRLTVTSAAANSRSRHNCGIAVRPMVAAIVAVAVARGTYASLWATAKLANGHNQR